MGLCYGIALRVGKTSWKQLKIRYGHGQKAGGTWFRIKRGIGVRRKEEGEGWLSRFFSNHSLYFVAFFFFWDVFGIFEPCWRSYRKLLDLRLHCKRYNCLSFSSLFLFYLGLHCKGYNFLSRSPLYFYFTYLFIFVYMGFTFAIFVYFGTIFCKRMIFYLFM